MNRAVGVLGGMGPEATLDFFAKVLRRAGARSDQDHLRLLIDNNPGVPDRNAALSGRGESPGPVLAQMARGLQASGADFLVMVCNTAHAFEEDILNATTLPFVSLIEETRDAALREQPGLQRVGLLATSTCLGAGLYQSAFAPYGVSTLALEGSALARFMDLLYQIKAGDTGPRVRAEMRTLALELVDSGAEVLVAGCTEVPLVLDAQDVPVPLVNSTDVLVERTLQYARGLVPLPERSVKTPA
ncbi:amino acid racemase [Deinococcus deserti]|uniref:Putative aspartate racemase n=1 Tax=Deinococcus deserti (strain DSM 17065 / CIP 109153 / LMG 22923 / VCD115) TaxID=546414 RepID=C1D469_DEIDV|nr:amino acid racemase [Deinococcus deserti]ACO47950.1 putative aspartate racemase [Deinococcus deserti VCD115]